MVSALVALALSSSARAQSLSEERDAALAASRAELLKKHIESFVLTLSYYGEEDKPFYRLNMHVMQNQFDSREFAPAVQLSQAEAARLIDSMAREGFLSAGKPLEGKVEPKAPAYVLRIWNDKYSQYEVLGWDLAMVQRLEALRKLLDGDAARAMDSLLTRLSGLRKRWQAVEDQG